MGGTYFPPEDRYGRPGLPRVLRSMAEAYQQRPAEVAESAASVMAAIEQNETFSGPPTELSAALLRRMLDGILGQFDARNGGFGSQPKFPHAAALDLLIDASGRPEPQATSAREVAAVTLARMAAGGMRDQLGGGFHRYSVDERWVVPHFEKMSYDNSELIRVYTHAFQSSAEPRFARVAASIMRWMDEYLSDRERGGFYASQDADATYEEDGDFYTWTREEARAALSPEEFEVAAAYFNLRPIGDMQHNPAKNVLHIVAEVRTLAERFNRSEETTRALLESAEKKLREERLRRPLPLVDQTIYTGWNGLCISAYLTAGRALALPKATAFALRSLDRVLAETWDAERGCTRVVAYGEPTMAPEPIVAGLEDYAFLATAALDAWEITGDLAYFNHSEALVSRLLEQFYDSNGGGFFDQGQAGHEARIGALRTKRKPVQDAPTPAGNAVAAALLLRLYALTGTEWYRRCAEETLEAFAGIVEHLGLYAASYGLALRLALSPAIQICILGSDPLAEELAAAALTRFAINKSIIRLRQDQLSRLPPALAETLPFLPGLAEGSLAVVCRDGACSLPVRTPEALVDALEADLRR